MKRDSNDMVAVFHQESDEKEVFELPLVPFILLAHSRTEVCSLGTKCLPETVKLKALLENGFYSETVRYNDFGAPAKTRDLFDLYH